MQRHHRYRLIDRNCRDAYSKLTLGTRRQKHLCLVVPNQNSILRNAREMKHGLRMDFYQRANVRTQFFSLLLLKS
jgi:hypothetical protein